MLSLHFLQLITSHHTFSVAEGLCRRSWKYLCFSVLFPKRKRSGGHLLNFSWQHKTWFPGYQSPSIWPCSEHRPLLPEGNARNQRRGQLEEALQSEREKKDRGWRESGWKEEDRDTLDKLESEWRKWQCVCVWSKKAPDKDPPAPWGRTGGYKTSALMLSAPAGPWWPLPSHLIAEGEDNILMCCM